MIYFAKSSIGFLLRPTKLRKFQTIWPYAKIGLIKASRLPIKSVRMFGWKVSFLSAQSLRQLYQEIFIENYYEPYAPLGQSPMIIDGGANIGLVTLYFKLLYPAAQIVCFEPHPVTFQLLCRNLTRNEVKLVEPCQRALASDASQYQLVGSDCTASLDSTAWLIPERTEGDSAQVKGYRLSDLVQGKDVDLLKLDVEGSEAMVLEELGAALKHIKQIVLEYHRWPGSPTLSTVLAHLEANGHEYDVRFWYEGGVTANCMVRSRMGHSASPGGTFPSH